jgi:pimeloyl-ACP methyl ester carboxylesterase
MDFRGHGQSQGSFAWTSKEYRDLLAVVDYAKSQSRRIAVVGFSLGAVAAIITASKSNHIRSLISISAPTELEKIDYQFWRLDIENDIFYNLLGEGKVGKGIRLGPFWLKKEKPICLIKKITTPMLFIHGEADWVIRPWHARVLYREANSPKRLVMIKNGPHAEYLLRKNKDEVNYWIKKWLDETLEGLF